MNSQALQKRIIDGKLFPHGPIGEWPCDEFRLSPGDGSEGSLSAGAANAERTEYLALGIPGHGIRNWGNVPRPREG